MRLEEVLHQSPEAKIIELLNSAHSSVWMSSFLHPDFFNSEKVRQAMENAVKNVGEFHLLLSSDVDWEDRKQKLSWIAQFVTEGKITLRKSDKVIPHWLFVDSKNFRLEKGHEMTNPLVTNNLIIYDATKAISDMLKDEFEQWWNNGSSIT